jgi:hypothetical protein
MHTKALYLIIDLDTVAGDGFDEGDTVTGAGATIKRGHHSYIPKLGQVGMDSAQAWGVNTIIICKQYVHVLLGF